MFCDVLTEWLSILPFEDCGAVVLKIVAPDAKLLAVGCDCYVVVIPCGCVCSTDVTAVLDCSYANGIL